MAVTVASPTASWDTIENVFYRRDDVYSMLWKISDLSDYLVAGAQCGGPIALMRDEKKVMVLGKHSVGKPKIYIYTSAGDLISTLTWDLASPLYMAWTSTEKLLVLADDGLYRLYDLQGEHEQFSLGAEASETGVLAAKIYDGGMVVLTGALNFIELKGWEDGRISPLAASGLNELPHSWSLIPPELSTSRHVEVHVATESTVVTIDALERIDQRLSRGPFTHIVPSPNAKFLALITATGHLWVVSADFSRNLSEVELTTLGDVASGVPDQVEWCGDNAVVLAWAGNVVVVGPGGESLSYSYPPAVHLVGEIDGVRVISSQACEFLQKVPDPTLAVFKPGSGHPAAILFDALDHFERKSPKSDENIRSIRPELASAVDTCIDAAGREVEPIWQRKLLRAAMFGRAFMDLYNPTEFVTMGETLKVLNAVRYYEVGIPITYAQYAASSPERLIARLTDRNLHLLALRVSRHLGLRPDAVLKHWACAKVARAGDDDDVCRAIVAKFEREGEKRVSYADIARRTWAIGRSKLATMLLDHERRAEEQVPLLLQMKEDKIALVKALDSGDTDLVYHVLLHLRTKLSPGDFFSIVDEAAPAVKLLQVYAREGDRELLRDYYYQDDRRTESACLEMEEAGASADIEERLGSLKNAAKYFGEHKDRAFEAKMAEDAHRLLTLQQAYQRELEHKYQLAGLSVNDTISTLLVSGFAKRAEKIRSDWKVPDKRWWWLKLKALVNVRDWEGLEAFAKSKKSPIGYEPFVTQLLEANQPKVAVNYVARCDAKQRVDFYVRCGDWGRAALECKERNDKPRLEQLKRQAPNGLAQREVEEVARKMTR